MTTSKRRHPPGARAASRGGALAEAFEEVALIVAREAPRILDILRDLHAHPEVSGEERRSARLLADALEAEGFEITRAAGGLETAFLARRPRGGGPARGGARVGLLAEYDALPDLGHACGHNVIASAAFGAAVAAGRLLGDGAGEIRLYGTPAEETIGGKAILASRGLFDDLDAAMMVHPGVEHRVLTTSLASRSVEVVFRGRAAHAVAHPEKGINALDALIQLFVAVDQIRRASGPDVRIPGVILHGGTRANIVPERAVARFSIRAEDGAGRESVLARLRRTAESIASATGCALAITAVDEPFEAMRTNHALAGAYRAHLVSEGIAVCDAPRRHMGSLDMGCVSQRVPAIHPYVAIAPPEVALHSDEFARAAVSEEACRGALLSARALARTAIEVLLDPELASRARREFEASGAREGAGGALAPDGASGEGP